MKRYRERLTATVWMYLVCALVIPASLLVFLPISLEAGVIVAAVLYTACLLGLTAWSPVIEVTDTGLRAGRALLPAEFIGTVEAFVEPEASLERGRRLDAGAWLLIRGWVRPVVKVENTDPADPTPYWLLSTRKPDELKAALTAERTAA